MAVDTYHLWAEDWAFGWSQNHPAGPGIPAPLGLAQQGQKKMAVTVGNMLSRARSSLLTFPGYTERKEPQRTAI